MSFCKSFVLVTGASKGFGAETCKQLAGVIGPGSVIVGLARDIDKLNVVKDDIHNINANIKFVPLRVDLHAPDVNTVRSVLERESSGDSWKTALVLHNAGTLGTTNYMAELTDFQDAAQYFACNVSSVFSINTIFVQHVKKMKETNTDLNINVINVSSLCAIVPFKSWSLYCSGKAARDMAFKVLALEYPDLKVLSYAPGALDTDMQIVARTATADTELREQFLARKNSGALLQCDVSVAKMINLMKTGAFGSGDHVDYYDC